MVKICSKCGKEKNLEEFPKGKGCKNGFRPDCNFCKSKIDKDYYLKNKEKVLAQAKEYRTNNKSKIREKDRLYKERNKEKLAKKQREISHEKYNKVIQVEKICQECNKIFLPKKSNVRFCSRKCEVKKWRNKNKDKINERRRRADKSRVYELERIRLKDPKKRIDKFFSIYIRNSIKDKCGRSWQKVLGYTLSELVKHLEKISGFSIENYSKRGLHIDHIIPKSLYKFNNSKDKEFKKCWNLRNLRLLPATENEIKNNKLDMKLVEEYNIFDLLPE